VISAGSVTAPMMEPMRINRFSAPAKFELEAQFSDLFPWADRHDGL
jgi:hypothetical protein